METADKKTPKKTVAKKTTKKAFKNPYERDENGLLKNVDHKFKEDGSVDWKAMIPSQFIKANDEILEKEGIEMPEDISKLEDYQKLILLGGMKEVAKIRGLVRRSTKVDYVSDTKAVVTTELEFIDNFEGSLTYSDTASATMDNTGGFGTFFLETIAANRSFVRAIRNALRIDILANDEMKSAFSSSNYTGRDETSAMGVKPYDTLKDLAERKGYNSFQEFKDRVLEKRETIEKNARQKIPEASVKAWEGWDGIEFEFIWPLIETLHNSKGKD